MYLFVKTMNIHFNIFDRKKGISPYLFCLIKLINNNDIIIDIIIINFYVYVYASSYSKSRFSTLHELSRNSVIFGSNSQSVN